ncbi:MAG: AmmeMemoRadiSam system radical SAM enzyme [Candidatus Omnitrophota bacterium]|nr:MAG: AmmeMemoRadiSam system radical SAM enzyme [Candidatus Omnitrophota bacterium]
MKIRIALITLVTGAFFFCILSRQITSISAAPENKPKNISYKQALYWESLGNNKVQCGLCPKRCILSDGQKGFCRARKNIKGTLYSLNYGYPVALHIDPIEKKPLAHVYPGTKSFSIATVGCNLRCKFCQNWEIAQLDAEKVKVRFVPPAKIVDSAKKTGCRTIAFTYTEPTIFFEYMLDIAKLAKKEGINCVIHSAGHINEKPLRELAKYIKAANIDLKGFTKKYYSHFCGGNLDAVLGTLKILKQEGVWIEITNLLVPGGNDSDEDISGLCKWIKENLGEDTPVHFSKFFPMYKLTNLSPTPLSTLIRARDIAIKNGLKFIYIGNVPQHIGEDTLCPVCGQLLIKRIGYTVVENNLKHGKCPKCDHNIPGIW